MALHFDWRVSWDSSQPASAVKKPLCLLLKRSICALWYWLKQLFRRACAPAPSRPVFPTKRFARFWISFSRVLKSLACLSSTESSQDYRSVSSFVESWARFLHESSDVYCCGYLYI